MAVFAREKGPSKLHGIEDSRLRFGELDEESASAYRQAVRSGRFTRKEIAEELNLTSEETLRIEQILTRLRLLQPMPGSPGQLAPSSPEAAVADLVGCTEDHIRSLQRAVTDIRSTMMSLMPVYFEGRRERNRAEAFDLITDVDAIRALLHEHRVHAKFEILTVQPNDAQGAAPLLASLRDSMLETLDRGVRLQTLYQHTARGDLITSSYVREVTAKGAEIRTTNELVDRLIVYDREVAFLPEQAIDGPGRSAIVVREPNLVAFMCKVFEYQWHGATPFLPDATQPEPITDEVKLSIIRLMSRGYKDEMVARRLGMSVRTCRRHIAELTEGLNAVSRFQAGVNAAMSGHVDLQESE
ncbi:hypothetical protein ABZW18_32435 [Streptomyces sp. NPDC004647]|uniref:hypothetical protein n=1 Tax=Streptomyces sp. NPDC004647 TaxID=3154671 RepID=UPI0033AA85A5